MYPAYRDIRERLGEPIWHDQHGVPRYDKFTPSLLGVYDDWASLFMVTCQACQREFLCGAGIFSAGLVMRGKLAAEDINNPEKIIGFLFSWGDAPRHGGCAGETMSIDKIEVLELWRREKMDWESIPLTPVVMDIINSFIY